MANDIEVTIAEVNTAMDAIAPHFNSGYLRLYSGVKPLNANTALSGNTLLAELRFNATAFGASVAGVITANAIVSDASADATGTAAFYRTFKSDSTTVLNDGTVGTSASDLNLNAVAISIGAQVDVTSFTLTLPVGG